MLDDRQIEELRVLQSAPEQSAIHDGFSVVGNTGNAGLNHLADFGQGFALLLFCYGANREHQRGRGSPRFGNNV